MLLPLVLITDDDCDDGGGEADGGDDGGDDSADDNFYLTDPGRKTGSSRTGGVQVKRKSNAL